MKLSNITPEQAHEVAMAAVLQTHEGSTGAHIARTYREAYLACNEEPELTGTGSLGSGKLVAIKQVEMDQMRTGMVGFDSRDPLHPDFGKEK